MLDFFAVQEQGWAVVEGVDWTEQVELTFGETYDEATKTQLVDFLEDHVKAVW